MTNSCVMMKMSRQLDKRCMDKLGGKIDTTGRVPRHLQVKTRILSLINQGRYQPGDRIPGEPEIADLLGVSRMTVNKAVLSLVAEGWLRREQGSGTYVSEKSEERTIRRVAAIIAYETEGALVDHYYGTLYWSLYKAFEEKQIGLDPIWYSSHDDMAKFKASDADAVIAISPSEALLDDLIEIRRSGVPVVILGASWRYTGFDSIDSDNRLGAALAVNHLVDLGHKRIGFLGAVPTDSNTIDRINGFQSAIKARRLKVDRSLMFMCDLSFELDSANEERLVQLLKSEERPTAFFVAGAKLAMIVLGIAHGIGLQVPRDLSVIAYDDPEWLRLSVPPLTTIRQPLEAMAKAAADAVIESLRTGDPRSSMRLFDPSFVNRESTARVTKRLKSL